MTEPIEPEADSALRRWGPWALFAGVVVVLCVGSWLRRHSLDDPFIDYRIVHQLEAGNGPVFNIGERVETFTSPLWLALPTVADLALPIRLELIGMGGGILTGAIGLLFAGLGAHLLHRGKSEDDHPRFLIPLGAFVLVEFPPTYRLIATGLEDGITITWLGALLMGDRAAGWRRNAPIVRFVAPVSFVAWPSVEHRVLRIAPNGVATLWIVAAGSFIRTASDDRATLLESAHAVTLDDFQATFPGPIAPRTRPGGVVYMYDALPYPSAPRRTPVVVQLGVGKVSYALSNDVYVLAALGLANPIAAHEKLRVRGWPGHENLLTQPWITALSTAPGSSVRQSSFPRPPAIRSGTHLVARPNQSDAAGRPFPLRVATARGVLGCARVERFEVPTARRSRCGGSCRTWSTPFRTNDSSSTANRRTRTRPCAARQNAHRSPILRAMGDGG